MPPASSAAPHKAPTPRPSSADEALERALEGLFRLGANRRFDQHQAIAVGAVVTRAGYAVLRSLADHETLTVGGLAEACAMDAATASRQVLPLVDEGLVERRAGAEDARRVELSLTPRGRAVYDRIVDYRLGQLTGVLESWSQRDRRAARRARLDSRARPRRDSAGRRRDEALALNALAAPRVNLLRTRKTSGLGFRGESSIVTDPSHVKEIPMRIAPCTVRYGGAKDSERDRRRHGPDVRPARADPAPRSTSSRPGHGVQASTA
ncbi:MAG: MarR family transcriptional regulator [Myxococcota bacterium]